MSHSRIEAILALNLKQENKARYWLYRRTMWKEHIMIEVKEVNMKLRRMYWFLGRNSELHLKSKLLLYAVIKPVRTYDISLSGMVPVSNIEMITQR